MTIIEKSRNFRCCRTFKLVYSEINIGQYNGRYQFCDPFFGNNVSAFLPPGRSKKNAFMKPYPSKLLFWKICLLKISVFSTVLEIFQLNLTNQTVSRAFRANFLWINIPNTDLDREWIAECVPTCEKSNDLRKVVVQDLKFKDFESQIVCARCHNQCKTTCKGKLFVKYLLYSLLIIYTTTGNVQPKLCT